MKRFAVIGLGRFGKKLAIALAMSGAEVIAIDQDPLGKQARIVRKTNRDFVLAKPLDDGSLAIGLFNLAEEMRDLSVSWKELGLAGAQTARDLWRQKDLEGTLRDEFRVPVAPHGVVLMRLQRSGK